MSALLRELEENHVEALVESADRAEAAAGKGTLYVTDCALWQKRLREKRLPVIIYLHEENREEQFMLAEYAIERISEIGRESLELAYLRLTGQPWTVLTTERCIIRETTTEDVDCFYEIYREPSITEYMEGLYMDRDAEVAYIQDYIKNIYRFYGYGMWTVLEKAGGKVIGRAGISWREGYDMPELGFVIAVPYQRQGYAYEICQAILAYGKEELGFTSFQALLMKGNKKSRALCEKLGFVHRENVVEDGTEYLRMVLAS
ncbi:MAG: GNAT family N-acetyltransferase [Blautia sp.]|nr:GNAT family N-acetyltransferase [Blautia sp.]